MTAAKRKVSVSLDADLVDELAQGGEALSKQVNDAIREALARQRRHRQLGDLLDALTAERGSVSAKIREKYERLLDG
ncbi:MAG: type II toxin-antitoxin system CcdA family antitoxin [Sandaracinaceae bacterium]